MTASFGNLCSTLAGIRGLETFVWLKFTHLPMLKWYHQILNLL